ncbi:MAG: mechanosensitive ion channel [Rhodospirillaceae bacterium]|nr:mechanosensitive ion channel [Rhodospirillaceae bacterium]
MDLISTDPAELQKQASQAIEAVMAVVATYGLKVVGAVVVLVGGWIVAGWAGRGILKGLGRSRRIDPTIVTFTASTARYAIIVLAVLAALSGAGVQTTSFVAVIGALGLAIGLSLQGTLNHVASGVLLIAFRPFRVGDFIEAGGATGTVKAITLFTTELATLDNVQVIIPNGQVWGGLIRNFAGYPTRRLDLEVGISYGDDIDQAFAVARRVIAAEPRILTEPEPEVAVSALADSAVNILVRVWTTTPDLLAVRWALQKNIKQAFDAAGISIPFPQRVVHHIHSGPETRPETRPGVIDERP